MVKTIGKQLERGAAMAGTEIADNLSIVQEKIAGAALRAGRDPREIRLVAVSKTVGVDRIRQALEAGVTILGENYVQESKRKIEVLGKAARWDFIGHLQGNKVKHAVNLFDTIHSVDRLSLARAISREAEKRGKTVRIFVQVNISGEEGKSGIDPAGAVTLVREITSLPNLSLEGLMTIPPYSDTPEEARPCYAALRKLRDTLTVEQGRLSRVRELSMGMSGDFEVAIEEGATLVRVGTAIFGERPF